MRYRTYQVLGSAAGRREVESSHIIHGSIRLGVRQGGDRDRQLHPRGRGVQGPCRHVHDPASFFDASFFSPMYIIVATPPGVSRDTETSRSKCQTPMQLLLPQAGEVLAHSVKVKKNLGCVQLYAGGLSFANCLVLMAEHPEHPTHCLLGKLCLSAIHQQDQDDGASGTQIRGQSRPSRHRARLQPGSPVHCPNMARQAGGGCARLCSSFAEHATTKSGGIGESGPISRRFHDWELERNPRGGYLLSRPETSATERNTLGARIRCKTRP
jgi:hypothetical protein